jgi:iron complex transport system ATP-binding protein
MTLLTLQNASAVLGGRTIIDAASVSVDAGELVALVGPNGAGKSTLLLMAANHISPAPGLVEFDGAPLSSHPGLVRARRIAFLAQSYQAAWLIPVQELAALGRHAWGGRHYDRLPAADRDAVDEALKRADIEHLRHEGVRLLSGGEQARANFARILATRADLILADEPCAALDPRHQLDAMAVLREEAKRGAGVVIASHDLALAERYADRIVVLDKGRIIADAPPQDALSESVLAQVFAVKRRAGGGFEAV